jgi:hypothetical protein
MCGLLGATIGTRAPLTQSVEYWSYEPKVAGSSPAWSSGALVALHLFFVDLGFGC